MRRRSCQSLCCSFTKVWRYWSNSWFTCLVCLSNCKCHAIEEVISTLRRQYSSLVKSMTNYRPLSNTTQLWRPWSFHIWCRNSLTVPSVVIVVWVEIKYALLKTEFTIIITTLYPNNSGSLITKSTLMVFYLVFGIASRDSSLSSKH